MSKNEKKGKKGKKGKHWKPGDKVHTEKREESLKSAAINYVEQKACKAMPQVVKTLQDLEKKAEGPQKPIKELIEEEVKKEIDKKKVCGTKASTLLNIIIPPIKKCAAYINHKLHQLPGLGIIGGIPPKFIWPQGTPARCPAHITETLKSHHKPKHDAKHDVKPKHDAKSKKGAAAKKEKRSSR